MTLNVTARRSTSTAGVAWCGKLRKASFIGLPINWNGIAMRLTSPMNSMTLRRSRTRTEVQWIPRLNVHPRGTKAGSEWAIADRELGRRDWASIDPQPVRKSGGVANYYTPALYFWQRTSTHVWCESQEERWQLLWLDFGGQIQRIWSQPLALIFGRESKLFGHAHIPDHMAQFVDGSFGLFDTKHPDRVDDLAQAQFEATEEVCRNLGWHYRALVGYDRQATRNLNCLSSSRHARCRPAPEIEEIILDAARAGRSREELCRLVSPEWPALATAWVDNLAWRKLLELDLSGVVNSATTYTTAEHALRGARP